MMRSRMTMTRNADDDKEENYDENMLVIRNCFLPATIVSVKHAILR